MDTIVSINNFFFIISNHNEKRLVFVMLILVATTIDCDCIWGDKILYRLNNRDNFVHFLCFVAIPFILPLSTKFHLPNNPIPKFATMWQNKT
jgi:hypothetical protein